MIEFILSSGYLLGLFLILPAIMLSISLAIIIDIDKRYNEKLKREEKVKKKLNIKDNKIYSEIMKEASILKDIENKRTEIKKSLR